MTQKILIQGRTVISNASSLLYCAIAGMGLTLLPNGLIDQALKDGLLVNLFPSYNVTETDSETAIWLVYPSSSYCPLKVQLWVEFLQNSIHQENSKPKVKKLVA